MSNTLKNRLAGGRVFYGPNGEQLRRDGERVVMTSPHSGRHDIDFAASSGGRIGAHWAGFQYVSGERAGDEQ